MKLVSSYGEWWDPHLVQWPKKGRGGSGSLAGRVKGRRGIPVDVWGQLGVYVLFQDWEVVYVGKTGKMALGAALNRHRFDDVAGRWDRFSWYGILGINRDGALSAVKDPIRQIQGQNAIAAMEALLIRVTAPSLNRRRESLRGAQLVIQDTDEVAQAISGRLAMLTARVDEVADEVAKLAESRPTLGGVHIS